MTTLVGKQVDFTKALQELIELDYDAVEAYEAAINRLESSEFKSKLSDFKMDHQRHISEIADILRNHNVAVPTGPSTKQWLTKGKVILAGIIGDHSLLAAMLTNEEDTNLAYDRMINRQDAWEDVILLLQKGFADEKRHKSWLESVVKK